MEPKQKALVPNVTECHRISCADTKLVNNGEILPGSWTCGKHFVKLAGLYYETVEVGPIILSGLRKNVSQFIVVWSDVSI